jgi:DNA polymerase kappa
MPEQNDVERIRQDLAPTGPTCPICTQTLPQGTSNQALNDHVDQCLNRDVIEAAGDRSSSDSTSIQAKKETKGTMLSWLKRV